MILPMEFITAVKSSNAQEQLKARFKNSLLGTA